MRTHRYIYICALAGSVVFYVLYPFWFSWYLTVLVLIIIPFDLIFSLPGMLTGYISIIAPRVLEHKSGGLLVITTLRSKPFPAGRIKVKLLVTGGDSAFSRKFLCQSIAGSEYSIPIDTEHCGLTVFKLRRVKATSLIGLFSIPVKVNCRAAVLVLPMPVKPPHIRTLPRGIILRPKPGGGFSEDHELRPYRHGDPIRSIHWKISAKHDSLVIREPLVPQAHNRLVQISRWEGAEERDKILGRLRWISDYLIKWELPYFVRIGNDGPIAEITGTGDLIHYLFSVLDDEEPPLKTPVSLPVRFSWVFRIDAKE